jgi:hypothetical protein
VVTVSVRHSDRVLFDGREEHAENLRGHDRLDQNITSITDLTGNHALNVKNASAHAKLIFSIGQNVAAIFAGFF